MSTNYTDVQLKVLEELALGINRRERPNDVPAAVQYINEGKGSFSGCISNLIALHELKSSQAWFAHHNLQEFKSQMFSVGKLRYIHCAEVEPEGWTTEVQYFYSLFSDCEPLIQWMMGLQPIGTQGAAWINNQKEHSFRHWQMTLALRGDWVSLRERAELFLSEVPAKMNQFVEDQKFYLALSEGDVSTMQDVLRGFLTPKAIKARDKAYAFGIPSSFISGYATLYAKIAWRHGYQVKIDSPFIPAAWLPVVPLSDYSDPYDFMRKYSIV